MNYNNDSVRRQDRLLSEVEAVALLRVGEFGVLSMVSEQSGGYGIPLSFAFDGEVIYFHCAKQGHKVDSLNKHDKVSFCIYDQGYQEEGQWPLHINSVIAFGRIKMVEDYEKTVEKSRMLGLKYYPTAESVEEEIKRDVSRVQLLEMTIEHMTGKLVKES